MKGADEMRFMSFFRPAIDPEASGGDEPCADDAAMGALVEEELRSGALVSTGGLGPSAAGALVRRAGGHVTVTDGPFAESKELIAGFAILEVASREEAIASARRFLDVVGDGLCEVRPLMQAPGVADGSRYLSLFRAPSPEPATPAPPSAEEQAAMGRLMERETKAGILVSTGGLGPSATGARVRRAGAHVGVVEGPFGPAEALVAGYAVLEAASKAEAIEAAKRFLQVAGDGECEVRPLWGPDDGGCLAG
jgi:hypothetical protein